MHNSARSGLQHLLVALAALAWPGAMVSAAHVRDAGDGPVPPRAGHRLIRMEIASTAQLQTALALGAEPWNCIIGLGEQDFSVSPRALAQLRAMGMRCVILHDDVQSLIDVDVRRMRAGAMGEGGVAGAGAWFDDFKTYPQVSAYMDTLVALRPDLAAKISAGTSIEGRTLHALRITSPIGANKPGVLLNGCQHAREWVAVMTPMFIADALVRDYGSDPRITAMLDAAEFYIIPIVNPDGYEYTYDVSGDRMWRKNRRDNGDGNFGVDLNRNWSVDWGGPNSTSTNTGSDVYIGTAPFSEPETAAVRDFALARQRLVAHIDFHSYGQLILQTWGYTNAEHPQHDLFDFIGTAMNDAVTAEHGEFYRNGWGGSLLYLASGTMRDWTFDAGGMVGQTVELRDRGDFGFILPPEQITPTAQEGLAAALTLTEQAIAGAAFFFPQGLPRTVAPDAAATLRVDIRATPQTALVPATARLLWRIGSTGPLTVAPMSAVGDEQYQATLPVLACGQRIELFFEIESVGGAVFTAPANAPASAFSATAARLAVVYNFQTTSGWTTQNLGATAGNWQRGVPVNDPNWPYDPRADADGSGSCWLTANTLGASDLDNGSVALISPVLNLPTLLQPGEHLIISYAWFLHVVSPVGGDSLRVDVSVNGAAGPWTTIITHGESGTHWRRHSITQSDLVAAGLTLTANTMIRFVATDGNPQSIVEAAVDDVRIWGDCRIATCAGDVDDDGVVDIDDLLAVISAWGVCGPPCLADVAPIGGNGEVAIDDLLLVISGWGPCPS